MANKKEGVGGYSARNKAARENFAPAANPE